MKRVRFRIEGSTVILTDWGIAVKRLPVENIPQFERPLLVAPEWRAELLAWQAGLCACCRGEELVLELDHDHHTGEARGLICKSCNVRLGHLERHGPVVLEPFKSYLEGVAK